MQTGIAIKVRLLVITILSMWISSLNASPNNTENQADVGWDAMHPGNSNQADRYRLPRVEISAVRESV